MQVSIAQRDLIGEIALPNLDFRPKTYSHAAIGGPKQARIIVYGEDIDLWELIERIRCPITIESDKGDAVWWGFIARINATIRNTLTGGPGIWRVGVDIDTMYNRIAVAYVKVDLTTGSQERDTTAWADDDISQDAYGIRELLWTSSSATQTHAEAARDAKLSQLKYPVPVLRLDPGPDHGSAILTCKGWWETLGWQYYANAGTSTVDTAEQVKDIVTAEGQFIDTIHQDVTSGITTREERDGDATALYEAMQLLQMGTTNNRRMLVNIDKNRHLRIYEEPAQTTRPHQFDSKGVFYGDAGEKIRKETCPVAFWVQPKDAIPPTVDTALLADPALQFVEEMEYDVENDELHPVMRGDLDPWKFAVVKDG